MTPAEVDRYATWHHRRLAVRPGLTCTWQVSGRDAIEFEEWMRLDVDYVNHRTLWLDLRLLLRTVPVVLRGQGI